MLTYEITAIVEPSLVEDYQKFMRDGHVPDLLATGCFVSASISRSENKFCIRYNAADSETLDRYLNEHAPRLRADFLARFPSGVDVTRDIWETVAEFSGD